MTDNKPGGQTPIYVSYSTLGTFLDWLRETKVTPTRIDRSLWSSKFNGAVGSQLMGGLRFLKLLDEDRPLPELEELVRADSDKRKELLLEVLRTAYGPSLVDELPGMTPGMLKERLTKLGTTDSTYDKAQSFFINAAKAVDLHIPASIAKKARNRSGGGRAAIGSKTRSGAKPSGRGQTQPPPAPPPSGTTRVLEMQSGGTVTITYSASLFDLDDYDQKWLLELVGRLKTYRSELPGGDGSRPGATTQEVAR